MKAPASDSDEALVKAARADPTAFDQLYQRHLDQVYRYFYARTGEVALAQDLTAQTFLAAFEQVSRYRGEGAFAAWLMGIARHKLMDHYRHRPPEVPMDAAQAIADPAPGPEQQAAVRLERAQVAQAMRALAPERAEALALRIFSGLSVAEIAQVMGKNESAVKMLVHRALRDLRARLVWLGEEDA